MTTKKRDKDAVLIARFLGWDVDVREHTSKITIPKHDYPSREYNLWGFGGYKWVSDFKFHYNWDWLMIVKKKVEDIENQRFTVNISRTRCGIHDNKDKIDVVTINGANDFDTVYRAIIVFIDWYKGGVR